MSDQKESKSKIPYLTKKFIRDGAAYDKERLEGQLEILVKHAEIDPSGRVLIKDRKLIGKYKVLLILISRFIANKLKDDIPAEATLDDVSESAYMERTIATARLNDAVANGNAIRLARGSFQIRPFKIDEILERVEYRKNKRKK